MRCPYHADQEAHLVLPSHLKSDEGWIGWLTGCCELPVWRCSRGHLSPIEAKYCTRHGCERPRPERVLHEVSGQGAPGLVHRSLKLAPASDGQSTPCLAGNVLVYLTDKGRVVAVDMTRDRSVVLAEDVIQASLRLQHGQVVGALRQRSGIRYNRWDVRDLRTALDEFDSVDAERWSGTGASLLGLPMNGGRLHLGAGLVRLVVEDDPIPAELAKMYQGITGARPGRWLIVRTPNPNGPKVAFPGLRPQRLHQVPVPLEGGVLVLGQLRWRGVTVDGALVIPTVGSHRDA